MRNALSALAFALNAALLAFLLFAFLWLTWAACVAFGGGGCE